MARRPASFPRAGACDRVGRPSSRASPSQQPRAFSPWSLTGGGRMSDASSSSRRDRAGHSTESDAAPSLLFLARHVGEPLINSGHVSTASIPTLAASYASTPSYRSRNRSRLLSSEVERRICRLSCLRKLSTGSGHSFEVAKPFFFF
jgi:hypothetical protein